VAGSGTRGVNGGMIGGMRSLKWHELEELSWVVVGPYSYRMNGWQITICVERIVI
jgi:hypothetical protein